MEEYLNQYFIGVFYPINNPKYVCFQCKFFTNECTTSKIEAKYGGANTPCCSEFEIKEQYETDANRIHTN